MERVKLPAPLRALLAALRDGPIDFCGDKQQVEAVRAGYAAVQPATDRMVPLTITQTGLDAYGHATPKELAAERARLIAELGWTPEDGTAAGRYVATATELREELSRARSARVAPHKIANPAPAALVSATDVARARAALRSPDAEQARLARELDPKAFRAARAWTWGRKAFSLSIGSLDVTPFKVIPLFSLHATEYSAAKGEGAHGAKRAATGEGPRPAGYRHDHDRLPHAFVCVGTSDPRGKGRTPLESARYGPPTRAHRMLFLLGELDAFEGATKEQRIEFPRGFLLLGDPSTNDMHVVRTGPARQHPPVWILRNGSPYRLTSGGIEW